MKVESRRMKVKSSNFWIGPYLMKDEGGVKEG